VIIMNKDDYINSVISFIKSKRDKRFIGEEISNHIDDETEYYQSRGYDYETALGKALNSMGDPQTVGTQLGKIHSGSIGNTVAWILFFLYILLYAFLLMTILGWGSALSSFTVATEAGIMLLSAASLLLSNRFKNSAVLFVSLIFTLIYFAGGIYFSSFNQTVFAFSPVLSADYFLITFSVDRFIQLCGLENHVQGILPSAVSVLLYVGWLYAYAVVYRNISAFNKNAFTLKHINREKRFNKTIIAFAIIQLPIAYLFSIAGFYYNDYNLCGSAQAYYDAVYILESDIPCDMKELFDAEKEISSQLSFHYDWGSIQLDNDGRFITSDVTVLEKEYNKCFTYVVNTLCSEYVSDKKYIAAVPVHYRVVSIDGGYVTYTEPDFSQAEWQPVSSVGQISGTLDVKEVKSYFYEIDIMDLNTDNADKYMDTVKSAVEYSLFDYDGKLNEAEFERIENLFNLQYTDNPSSDSFIYEFGDENKSFIINSQQKTIAFYQNGELTGTRTFLYE